MVTPSQEEEGLSMKSPMRLVRGFDTTAVKCSIVSSLVSGLIVIAAVPTLVDAKVDAMRAGQFVAVGENGAERIKLVPGSGDEATVALADAGGNDRIRLLVQNDPDGSTDTGIGIHAANGKTIMRLGNTTDPELPAPLRHSANLILRDESGHDRIRLLVSDDGNPKIELINAAGELVWSAP
jgi:hypothetical protein